jgi:hypothetical protein
MGTPAPNPQPREDIGDAYDGSDPNRFARHDEVRTESQVASLWPHSLERKDFAADCGGALRGVLQSGFAGGRAKRSCGGDGNSSSSERRNGAVPGPLERQLAEDAGRMVQVRFALYQDQAGVLALWNEMQTVKVGSNGRYSVLLGATSAEGLPQTMFQASDVLRVASR